MHGMPSKIRPKMCDKMEQTTPSTARGGVRKNRCSVRRKRTLKSDHAAAELGRSSVGIEKCKKKFSRRVCENEHNTALAEVASPHSTTCQAKGGVNSSNSGSRKMDKHLAMIFMGIVLIFLGR